MPEVVKKSSFQSGLITEIKTLFSFTKSQKTLQFAYGCMLALVLFTVFLTFSPSSFNGSNIFSLSSINNNSSVFSQNSYGSHFSSVYSYFFPNSSQTTPSNSISPPNSSENITQNRVFDHQNGEIKNNQSTVKTPISPPTKQNQSIIETPISPIKQNQSITVPPISPIKQNQSIIKAPNSPKLLNYTKTPSNVKNSTDNKTGEKNTQKGTSVISNVTSSKLKKQSNESDLKVSAKQRTEELVKKVMSCDLFDGEWVKDDSYPLYKPGSCPLIDEQFNCFLNGRPDNGFYKFKWKPKGCSIPRLNGTHMLEMLRGKRLVFVGDSLNRNMWESLVCILRNSAKDKSKVYEASGRHHFRTEPSYSFVFKDYGCTVEFFVSPFLVQEWEVADRSGSKKETLRLDLVGRSSDQYKTADFIVFNTGHWWTHEKTAKGKDYYQEGSHIYHDLNVLEAFRKALTTWGKWIDQNVNPKKSLVFFRGYSASHFSGGQWNSGGQCDHEAEPIKNSTYLSHYPPKMTVLEKVLKNMKNEVSYLNITRLTDYRKDGHPSIYRKQIYTKQELQSPLSFQDCSHWCLPGVPDAWNELLYAELLIKTQSWQQWQSP